MSAYCGQSFLNNCSQFSIEWRQIRENLVTSLPCGNFYAPQMSYHKTCHEYQPWRRLNKTRGDKVYSIIFEYLNGLFIKV